MPFSHQRPQRPSLVAETVKLMREAIHSGAWSDHLPSERALCEQWQISRPTLRAALDVMQRERLIEVTHGRRTRVLVPSNEVQPRSLTVGLLSPEPLQAMPPFVMLWVDELRGQLAAAGHLLHVQVGRAGFGKASPAKALAALVASTPAAVWVLYQTTESMQRWFAGHVPRCMVVGSLFPGIELPAVDRDYRAVCRHGVGLLAGRGHRKLGLLIQKHQLAGDVDSERGFAEGLESARQRGVTGEVLHHDGTTAGICKTLDAVLAGRQRPSALLIAKSGYALTAITHLLRRGIRVPEDMALVCRDDDGFLDSVVPGMARYTVSPAVFAKRVFRMVMNLLQDGQVKDGNVRVTPSFIARESI